MTPDNFVVSDHPAVAPHRKGCLIEMVVASGIVGIATLLLIPAVNSSRNAARRAQFT